MIPLRQLMPQQGQSAPQIRIDPEQIRVVAQRIDPNDMQATVDRLTRQRRERRDNDTLMHTLIYSVWRRK